MTRLGLWALPALVIEVMALADVARRNGPQLEAEGAGRKPGLDNHRWDLAVGPQISIWRPLNRPRSEVIAHRELPGISDGLAFVPGRKEQDTDQRCLPVIQQPYIAS
jgi:hypothetical protein